MRLHLMRYSRVFLIAFFSLSLLPSVKVCALQAALQKRPNKQELADAIASADRVVITEPLEEAPIFESSSEGIGREFLTQFTIAENADGFHCMCYGEAWISFYRSEKKLATIGFHHATSIRWIHGPWSSDALLNDQDGIALSQWFAKKGFAMFENTRVTGIAFQEAEQKKKIGFMAQLPALVRELIEEPYGSGREHTIARRALASSVDRAQLAASVFRAFGQLPLKTSGYDNVMLVAEKIIEISEGTDLVRALELIENDPVGLKGAAYLFVHTNYHRRLPAGMTEVWGPKLAIVVLNDPEDDLKPYVLRRLNSIPGKVIDDFFVAIASGKVVYHYAAHLNRSENEEEPELVSAACLLLAMRHHPLAPSLSQAQLSHQSDRPSKMALETALALSSGTPPLNPELFGLKSFLLGEAGLQALSEMPADRAPAKLVGAALSAPWGAVREDANQLAFKLGVGPAKEPEEHNSQEIEYDRALAHEKPAEALKVYTEQLELARGTTKADLLSLRGIAYTRLGRNQEALADFSASRELDYRRDEIPRMIATALWQLGRSDEAIESISRVFPMGNSWNLEVRGLAHLSKGDFVQAERDLSASVLIDPRAIYRQFFQHLAACLSSHPELSRLDSLRNEAIYEIEDDTNLWLQKIVDLLLHQISGDTLLQFAQNTPSTKRVAREAEACFYVGQLSRIAGETGREKELLLRCVSLKQFQLTEHWLAAVRLSQMN